MSTILTSFAVRKAMTPYRNKRIMKETETNNSESKSFHIKHDKAQELQHCSYEFLWKQKRVETEHVSNIVKKLIDTYDISKSAIYETAKMSKNCLKYYLNIPDNVILTDMACYRMAITVAIIVPQVIFQLRKDAKEEKNVKVHHRHIFDEDKDLDDFVKEYIRAFDGIGEHLVHNINSQDELIKLRNDMHDIFVRHKTKLL